MATHQLNGQIGTDPNFTPTTHTGHSRSGVKASHDHPKIELTAAEQEICDGKKGDVLQKAMKTVVSYGELFGADKLVDLGGAPHHAVSWGSNGVEPLLKIYKQLADAGLKTYAPFTADPKPMDPVHLPVTKEEQAAVDKIYNRMDELEDLNMKLGMRSKKDWSCACYLPEMGNTPSRGDCLAWSESSAINYVNSVLGARTNRNSMGIDMLCNILGKAPHFGLLTDEGRQAVWLIDVKTTKLPHPEMIGSAIGLKVMEDVSSCSERVGSDNKEQIQPVFFGPDTVQSSGDWEVPSKKTRAPLLRFAVHSTFHCAGDTRDGMQRHGTLCG